MANSNRASLLAGLRTGGVRSSSGIPQTAAPYVQSFNVPDAPMTAAVGGSFNAAYNPYADAQMQQAYQHQMQALQTEFLKLQVRFCSSFSLSAPADDNGLSLSLNDSVSTCGGHR